MVGILKGVGRLKVHKAVMPGVCHRACVIKAPGYLNFPGDKWRQNAALEQALDATTNIFGRGG
jgi:hypothetical protein